MSALTQERLTPRVGQNAILDQIQFPVKANTKIFAGGIVVMASGVAKPAATATGLIACGVALVTADNTGGADGAINVTVQQGVFRFDNSTSGDLIAAANIGADCYLVDDHTVALTSNSSARSRAGKVIGVDTDGSVLVLLAIGL